MPAIPWGTGPSAREEAPGDRTTAPPEGTFVVAPEAPPGAHANEPGDGPSERAPRWPARGWALQPPRAAGVPKASKAHGVGLVAAAMLASVLALGGLFTWVGFNNFAGQTRHAWALYPHAQAYYQPIVRPDVPASATLAALPPMVVSTPSANVTLKIDAPPLGGMYGSTGQVQDAYSPAYFAVPVGKTVHVTVVNYDAAWHTFTAPTLGLNVWIRPAGAHPSTTSFSFTAPRTGYFGWLCNLPCDPYAMGAPGYMKGEVHAVKA